MLKSIGYLVSGLSVLLLGLVSLKSALEEPAMLAALIGGMAASAAGMYLRWLSYREEHEAKGKPARPRDQATAASASWAGSNTREKLPE
jgi:hypothetical protein